MRYSAQTRRSAYDVHMPDEPLKHTSIDFPESLHRALKVYLAGEGKTINDWAREHAAADTAEARNQPHRRPAKQ